MHRMSLTPRIRKSPYYAATVEAGASDFTVYNKMLMPMCYGDSEHEYRHLTTGVTMWDVAAQRQVEVSGPDANQCVQYLVARDLSTMSVGQGKYVAMCSHDGTLLNDPVLLKLSDGRYWFSLADHDMLLWVRAVAAERGFDVTITEPDVSPLAIQGPRAEDLVATLFGESIRKLKFFWFIETALDDIPLVLCRAGWSKQGGFELFLQDGQRGTDLWNLVASAGKPFGIVPATPNHIERIESGLLSWGGDTTPESNPFEAGMERFVDVDTDAVFIGKAALQAIKRTGPRRRLVGIVLDEGSAAPGPLPDRAPITLDGVQVGTLSALARSPKLDRTVGIAQIDSEVVAADKLISVEAPGGTCIATIRELPFI